MTVCAIVLTHDRRELLHACLAALGRQTHPPDRVLVIDNASTDGSRDMLAAEFAGVEVLRRPENDGSAAGFRAGIEHVHGNGFDWLWMLHDDVVPTDSSLEELLSATARIDDAAPAVIASKPVRPDGELDEVGLPRPNYKRIEHAVIAYEHGLQPVRWTSLASVLIRGEAIARHGLPVAAFAGASGELEFTARMLRRDDGYLAPRSVVEHRRTPPSQEPETAFARDVGDRVLMLRSRSWGRREKVDLTVSLLRAIATTVRSARGLGLVMRAAAGSALRPLRADQRTSGPWPAARARP